MADRIEKQMVLRAPRARVWRAISDKTEFGQWFGVKFPAGTFASGETVSGNITYPGYEHLVMDIDVVDVVPEQRLSYRWHPYAIDASKDYSSEPKTLASDSSVISSGLVTGHAQMPAGRHRIDPRCDMSAKRKPPLP